MGDEIKTWLADIKQAIIEINDFLPDQKNFHKFKKDLKTKRAIERNVEIIGEAANRILKQVPGIAITEIKKIIDTRNKLYTATIVFPMKLFGQLLSSICQDFMMK